MYFSSSKIVGRGKPLNIVLEGDFHTIIISIYWIM